MAQSNRYHIYFNTYPVDQEEHNDMVILAEAINNHPYDHIIAVENHVKRIVLENHMNFIVGSGGSHVWLHRRTVSGEMESNRLGLVITTTQFIGEMTNQHYVNSSEKSNILLRSMPFLRRKTKYLIYALSSLLFSI